MAIPEIIKDFLIRNSEMAEKLRPKFETSEKYLRRNN